MENNSLLKITLEYAFDEMEESMINWILVNELEKAEKLNILIKLNDNRIKQILLNAGFKEEYLKTI